MAARPPPMDPNHPNQPGRQLITMTALVDLTATYIVVSENAATAFEGGEAFWRRLAHADPELAAADGGWLISSYQLDHSWDKWEMHPKGDEIVSCRKGSCEFILETDDGPTALTMTAGKTVLVPKGTWHTVRVAGETELLHITYGSGTTFKPLAPAG
jgi:mannose-6-phosphate isomerase-like protein (cupin superfamily)